jgi:hypothetical protein
MSERMKKPTTDLVITCIAGYGWEQIRPFALSLLHSGFKGDKIILAGNTDPFVIECLDNRGFDVVQFNLEGTDPRGFVIKQRFIPLLRFLAAHKHEYRYVIWADAGDQIFQSNPSIWLEQHLPEGIPALVAARECWRIKDETQFNAPWAKATVPDDYEWLCNQEICCGGTIAGDAETVFRAISKIYEMLCANPAANDQAAWSYLVHKPFAFPVPTKIWIPDMSDGWTATCSAVKTPTFSSIIGRDESLLTDKAPVFDMTRGLVLTPDGKTPFALVHQYNRDGRWTHIIHQKYRWD